MLDLDCGLLNREVVKIAACLFYLEHECGYYYSENVYYIFDYVHKSYAEISLLLFANIYSPNQYFARLVNLTESRV